jgi:hypothetical protein
MVINSEKYDEEKFSKSIFEVRMVLVIRNFQPRDVGSYRCIAKNSLGEVESNIRLYGEYSRACRNTVKQVSP